MTARAFHTDTRGVSPTIGFIFIISIVIVSVTALVAVGAVTINESQSNANEHAIDQSMTQLDSQMSLVAFEGGSEQTVDLSAGSEENLRIQETGNIRLELQEINETDPTQTDTIAVILDEDLGTLQYETSERTIAFQGGGVWAMRNDQPGTAQMVSPPEFSYTDDTATLPFVTVATDEDFVSSDGRITMKEGDTQGLFPQPDEDVLQNPVDPSHDLVLTVESDYYQAWGTYFEERLGLTPVYDHDNNEVEVILVAEGDDATVEQAITSVGSDNRIIIDGQGGDVFIDSYDSRLGDYSQSVTEDGEISAQTGIEITSGAEVLGHVVTEGDLILSGNSIVHGDATVNGNIQEQGSGSEIRGDIYEDAEVGNEVPIDRIIESVQDDFSEENDNNDATRIDDGEITTERVLVTDDDPTIHAGEYYLSEFELGNEEKVTFDLSNGDIRIVVDDDIEMDRAEIEVINNEGNDNRVQIYTRGDTMEFDRSTVTVEGDESTAMWFYGGAGTLVDLHRANVTGVMYAPGTDEIPGEVDVSTDSALYGGVVGGDTSVGAQSSVHYDQALMETDTFTEAHHVEMVSARIAYFHISWTEIEVEDS